MECKNLRRNPEAAKIFSFEVPKAKYDEIGVLLFDVLPEAIAAAAAVCLFDGVAFALTPASFSSTSCISFSIKVIILRQIMYNIRNSYNLAKRPGPGDLRPSPAKNLATVDD
uniref:Uncharacterized protein n=1 Tax=Romanomermis culicivorax TaxID=13658 RepID=A0A915IUM5_ROMCU